MSRPEPTEEELRAAYEAELARITVADVVVQTVVSLVNLAGRRLGLSPGAEQERDLEQVRDAVDSVRALLPVLERHGASELAPIREALSQLQFEYARLAGAPDAPGAPTAPTPGAPAGQEAGASAAAPGAPTPEGEPRPGPAESSGRLWIPGR
jgi:hypothetical protein